VNSPVATSLIGGKSAIANSLMQRDLALKDRTQHDDHSGFAP